jgi:hypothetical protein
MHQTSRQRLLAILIAGLGAFLMSAGAGGAPATAPVKAQHHHNGKQLAAPKLKQDGHHELEKHGKYTTSVDVKGGKITALHVNHSEKGEIPVKKYKSHQKMARVASAHLTPVIFQQVQYQDLGEEYIGYSYVDDYGNEEIYWFPVEEIYDGDTGAIEYVPLSS